MYPYLPARRTIPILLLVFIVLLAGLQTVKAQCTGWTVNATNINPSECVANGSFSIVLAGTDVANLTNIQYSIPLTPGGFSVLANSSADFSNIPPGTYTVKVNATCNSTTVSKTTTVTVAGSYIPPTLLALKRRSSFSCANTGQIHANLTGSSYPYTISITAHPVAYTGPLSILTSAANYTIDSLPPGTYTVQMVDTCGSATAPQTINIISLNPTQVPLGGMGYSVNWTMGNGCNKIDINKPEIGFTNDPDWDGYYGEDTLFEVAYSLDGGITKSAYEEMNGSPFHVTLPAGKTYKDLYPATITWYIKTPCNQHIQKTGSFHAYDAGVVNVPQCSGGFRADLTFSGLTCYPITITAKDINTNITYGPYTTTGSQYTTPVLPYGSYNITCTTGDGYSKTLFTAASQQSGNHYSVGVSYYPFGLHNYAKGFTFNTSLSSFIPGTKIKLLTGPPGYAYSGTVLGTTKTHLVEYNQAPPANNNAYFKHGTYVWEVDDGCGKYNLSWTVNNTNTFRYTMDLDNRQQSCTGLRVYPTGTAMINASTHPVTFAILDGPPGYSNTPIAAGGYLTLPLPGTYTLGISAASGGVLTFGSLPNPYQVTDTIVYDPAELQVDINNTQGFLCIGASAGQGQIVVKGMDGTPYKSPVVHYKYSLAAAGKGLTGPYIANNTTGEFAAMGINANDIYDVKIEDSCGAFVVQQIKVLDLATTQLASASANELCEGETLELYCLPLPGSTYSWVGPNSFGANVRNPVITNIPAANTGTYTVTVTSKYCVIPVSSSVNVKVNPLPAKAGISVVCIDTTAILTATGSLSGYTLQWYKNKTPLSGETGLSYTVTEPGVYRIRTINPTTGCENESDSVAFTTKPGQTPKPVISASLPVLCAGDTSFLTATASSSVLTYQWYFNGAAIAGATQHSHAATTAGNYTVAIATGPCNSVAADTLKLQKLVPAATIKPLGDTVFCEGESVILYGNTGMGLSYTWKIDGVAQRTHNISYKATRSGSYTLEVYNGYCTATSAPVKVLVNPTPVAEIEPGGIVNLCEGETITLVTPEGANYRYAWFADGISIPGAMGNMHTASAAGKYSVIVSNDICPQDTSTVVLNVVPMPDATIAPAGPLNFCKDGDGVLSVPLQGGVFYAWYRDNNEIAFANEHTYAPTQTGSYTAVASNTGCADTSLPVRVAVHPLPKPVIKRKDLVLRTGAYTTYQWKLEEMPVANGIHQAHTLVQTGTYTVTVTDSNGCEGTSEPYWVVSLEEGCIVRLPTAFTPNGDGLNDVFRLVSADDFELKELQVVNRWGQVVFRSTDARQGWDGTFKGTPQEVGTYFYFVQYKCDSESNTRMRKGDVVLTR